MIHPSGTLAYLQQLMRAAAALGTTLYPPLLIISILINQRNRKASFPLKIPPIFISNSPSSLTKSISLNSWRGLDMEKHRN